MMFERNKSLFRSLLECSSLTDCVMSPSSHVQMSLSLHLQNLPWNIFPLTYAVFFLKLGYFLDVFSVFVLFCFVFFSSEMLFGSFKFAILQWIQLPVSSLINIFHKFSLFRFYNESSKSKNSFDFISGIWYY